MLLRILPVIFFFVSAITLFGQAPINPVAIAPGSDMPPIEPGVSQELAKWRAARYSDVRYKLNLTLEKMSPVMKGTMEIRVKVGAGTLLSPTPQGVNVPPIILDWRKIKGHEEKSTISNVSINGRELLPRPVPRLIILSAGPPRFYDEQDEHLIFSEGVIVDENVIKLDFTSPILTSGSAITRYVDKEDGAEYIYSLFVPSDASTAFPVFDQPDLKARFKLGVTVSPLGRNWDVISNTKSESFILETSRIVNHFFEETGPISTYVFAFAAGPFERVVEPPALTGGKLLNDNPASGRSETSPPDDAGGSAPTKTRNVKPELKEAYKKWLTNDVSIPMTKAEADAFRGNEAPPATAGGTDLGERVSSPTVRKGSAAGDDPSLTVGLRTPSTNIYVRKSQVEKFKPHAAGVFRLNREAVKYFEEYFDYKFPFPKYDLVLIPEFPFGGMEHAGATFLRESAIIFPQEPTKNDHISRAVLIFHEAAHQWFGDTVTMRWFDDLWLKEGFANFAAYKAMERIMPEANAWKVFYERIKQSAYQTDSTRGTTPIYQEIKNLSAAKSAYGNIVYNKAPAFLRQAEFYLGEDKFQTAVRTFLKKHEFGNAGWEDLVKELERSSGEDLKEWANVWVKERGLPLYRLQLDDRSTKSLRSFYLITQDDTAGGKVKVEEKWRNSFKIIENFHDGETQNKIYRPILLGIPSDTLAFTIDNFTKHPRSGKVERVYKSVSYVFPNYQDYGYGIFLLDDKSRDYVLKNIKNEKDSFLRSMMWGTLWDSVREGELDPREYVELVVKVLSASSRKSTTPSTDHPADEASAPLLKPGGELNPSTPPIREGSLSAEDESTVATLLGRTATALNYYLIDAERVSSPHVSKGSAAGDDPSLTVGLRTRVENLLIERMQNADTLGERITYYRAFLNIASSGAARGVLKQILNGQLTEKVSREQFRQSTRRVGGFVAWVYGTAIPLKTKDKFDIVTKLLILGDADAPELLAELEKTETSDEAKRYAYAARAGIATAENKAKYWNDFVNNKEISESWIEAAFGPWNSIRHSELTLPYLQKALQELPNHKRSRKIFFVNGWLGAFIGGQRSEEALAIVNKFLADNPDLDKDLRLKILENVDVIERAVKIRQKFKN